MSDKLEYDPKTKSMIKDALHAFLYAPVNRQFASRLETIIERNSMMGDFGHRHFIYKGVLYSSEVSPPPLRKNRLVPQLRVTMDEYLADKHRINHEELPYVVSFINQVLNSSSDLADYMRVLPESTHQPLRALMATCPCRSMILPEDTVESLRLKNQQAIDLMKKRLVTNLLI